MSKLSLLFIIQYTELITFLNAIIEMLLYAIIVDKKTKYGILNFYMFQFNEFYGKMRNPIFSFDFLKFVIRKIHRIIFLFLGFSTEISAEIVVGGVVLHQRNY